MILLLPPCGDEFVADAFITPSAEVLSGCSGNFLLTGSSSLVTAFNDNPSRPLCQPMPSFP